MIEFECQECRFRDDDGRCLKTGHGVDERSEACWEFEIKPVFFEDDYGPCHDHAS
mgnify:FL=1